MAPPRPVSGGIRTARMRRPTSLFMGMPKAKVICCGIRGQPLSSPGEFHPEDLTEPIRDVSLFHDSPRTTPSACRCHAGTPISRQVARRTARGLTRGGSPAPTVQSLRIDGNRRATRVTRASSSAAAADAVVRWENYCRPRRAHGTLPPLRGAVRSFSDPLVAMMN
jgi:hypothetical protein